MNTFSKDEYHAFLEEGFVIKQDFFNSAEVLIMQNEIERLLLEGKFRNVATDEDGTESKSKQNLQLIPLYDHSKVFRSLPFQKKVIQ
ncbi:uncharacterized protein METZ01_LOCUS276382, partial [marine metagenome]